jgi:hypothetical protein
MLAHSPSIITQNLVLCLDAANSKSYPGSGTTWTDLSGRGNTGTLVNGVGYNSSNLGSLSFDGVDDKVTVSDNSSISLNTYTIAVWFRSSTNSRRILVKEANNNVTNYSMQINASGYFECGIFDGTRNPSFANTSKVVTDNNWHYGVLTRTNQTTNGLSIYIDNFLQQNNDTTAGFIVTSTSELSIGNRTIVSSPFNGNIAQVSIYNRALTAQEIQQNFNALKGRFGLT